MFAELKFQDCSLFASFFLIYSSLIIPPSIFRKETIIDNDSLSCVGKVVVSNCLDRYKCERLI